MRVFDTDYDKNADQLQEEGRAIAAWGGFVYVIDEAQIPTFLEYQVPFILRGPIPEDALEKDRAPSG